MLLWLKRALISYRHPLSLPSRRLRLPSYWCERAFCAVSKVAKRLSLPRSDMAAADVVPQMHPLGRRKAAVKSEEFRRHLHEALSSRAASSGEDVQGSKRGKLLADQVADDAATGSPLGEALKRRRSVSSERPLENGCGRHTVEGHARIDAVREDNEESVKVEDSHGRIKRCKKHMDEHTSAEKDSMAGTVPPEEKEGRQKVETKEFFPLRWGHRRRVRGEARAMADRTNSERERTRATTSARSDEDAGTTGVEDLGSRGVKRVRSAQRPAAEPTSTAEAPKRDHDLCRDSKRSRGSFLEMEMPAEEVKWPKFLMTLGKAEVVQDLVAITGNGKYPQRPKRRHNKAVARSVLCLTPGIWLCKSRREWYEVNNNKKQHKKKGKGLKAMTSSDEDLSS